MDSGHNLREGGPHGGIGAHARLGQGAELGRGGRGPLEALTLVPDLSDKELVWGV